MGLVLVSLFLILMVLTSSDKINIETSGALTYEENTKENLLLVLINNEFKNMKAEIDIIGSENTKTIEENLIIGENFFNLGIVNLGIINSIYITPIN
jgi:hypothetical protein